MGKNRPFSLDGQTGHAHTHQSRVRHDGGTLVETRTRPVPKTKKLREGSGGGHGSGDAKTMAREVDISKPGDR